MRRSVFAVLSIVMAAAGLAAGCASSKLPERFHTLLAAASAAPAPIANPVYVDVLPVQMPAQVDHAQWVVRQPDDSLLVLEQERWAAPLSDELRGAVVEHLAARWNAVDVRGVGQPVGAVWRVRIDVQRFESMPGREARVEATWSLSVPASAASARAAATLVCRSAFAEPVAEGGVPALAAAHRRIVGRLADEIGPRLKAMSAGEAGRC